MRASCVICTEVFKSGLEMCVLGCGHVYHASCIVQCFITSPYTRCPQCRVSTDVDKIIGRLYLNEEAETNDQDLAESVNRLREENDSLKDTVRHVSNITVLKTRFS
jgi:hypothetical protein